MKRKSRPKILFGICITLLQIVDQCRADRNCTSIKNENIHGRNAFSPRMDFNQWKPLGRGDPLKNDPTYDYVPPVLDQVHYWMEPAMRKPDPPLPEDSKKTEILLLGVLSKKSASPPLKVDSRRDNLDPYHKKEPKYNPHQRIAKPTFSFFPESLFNTLSKYTSTETKQNIPYTVLMPPPMNYNPTQTSTTNNFMPSTSPHVTIQPSHLIYQSSSLSDEKEWLNKNQYATVSSSTSWKTSTIKPYVLTTKNYRENLVFNKNLQPPESFIHIEFSPRNYSLIGADSNYNLNYVTPPSLKNAVNLHKGSISDNSAELHNTYVKIEKPEFYSTALSGNDDYVSVNTAPLVEIYTHMQHPVEGVKNMKHPVRDPEMETIKNMQTLLPPPNNW
ncbi:unnamed protein product [Brassicogethes aeneus]|uniref:Uncharacterized protein n=1 Tax=Brassicogethes aeneus TaxID=1431903 RepID=A0A9P0BFU7_BRAAE|nr:unnamed protein product [Brassicogethes aeneus]